MSFFRLYRCFLWITASCYDEDMPQRSGQRIFGLLAQALAERYLVERKRWRILGCNIRAGRAEIDVVGKAPDGSLRAVEVKGARGVLNPDGSVRRLPAVLPVEHLSRDQLARIARALRQWRSTVAVQGNDWGVDVCLVIVDEQARRARVEHLERLLEGRWGRW